MKTSMFAKFALVTAVMMACAVPSGHSASNSKNLIPPKEIERDFWYLNGRIDDGKNELKNAVSRFDKAFADKSYFELCERNVVLSYVRLDQARHRLEPLPNRMERVEGSTFMTARMWRDKFNKMYLESRNNAHNLENDLRNFTLKLERLHPCKLIKAYLNYRDSIWSKEGDEFEKLTDKIATSIMNGQNENIFEKTSDHEQQIRDAVQNKNVSEMLRLYDMFKNDPRLQGALLNALTSGPNPMSPDDARAALEAYSKGDIKALQALLAKYPGNAALRAMLEKLGAPAAASSGSSGVGSPVGGTPGDDLASRLAAAVASRDVGAVASLFAQNPSSPEARNAMTSLLTSDASNPMSAQDAQAALDAFASGDKAKMTELLKKYPNNQALRELARKMGIDPDAAIRGGSSGGTSVPSNPVSSGPSAPTAQELDNARRSLGDSQVVVDPDWAPPVWDPVKNEIVMGPNVSRTYMGRKGGRLTQETEVTATWRRGDTKPQITYGKKSAWSIQVEKGGPGYQVVNMSMDGGEITVDSWTVTGQGGNVVKSGSGTDIAVDFPASGRYTIKATGKTKPGNSPFEIEQPVDVQK